MTKLKVFLKKVLPKPIYQFIRIIPSWKDLFACISFLNDNSLDVPFQKRLRIVKQLYITSFYVDSAHTQEEILNFIHTILSLPSSNKGVLVEAGCYKGSSTAKFSLTADMMGRELVVFDSFQGIPENVEIHDKNIFGGIASFQKGDYCGTLEEVKENVTRFWKVNCCRFIKGYFEDTMPDFKELISAIYLDVDLASSTRTCLKHLYPLLEKGGILYSQDGHLPLVIDVFNDEDFWLKEIGYKKPAIEGLGKRKLIGIVKET